MFGDKSKPPDLGDEPLPPELAEELEDEEENNKNDEEVNEGAESKTGDAESEGAVGGEEDTMVMNNLEGLSIENKVLLEIYFDNMSVIAAIEWLEQLVYGAENGLKV